MKKFLNKNPELVLVLIWFALILTISFLVV